MSSASATKSQDLQALGFVPDYIGKGVQLAESGYVYVKGYVPSSALPTVDQLEAAVGNTVAPYVAVCQDKGEKVLLYVDSKVGSVALAASGVLEQQRKFHTQNLEHYKAAREAYLKRIEEFVEYLKNKGIYGSAKSAVESVTAQLARVKQLPAVVTAEAQQLLVKLNESFKKLLDFPQVKQAIDHVQPAAKDAWSRYEALHNAVVANPNYKLAYGKSQDLLGYIQTTSIYKFTAATLYPVVSPVADKVLTSQYYSALLDHVKPAAV